MEVQDAEDYSSLDCEGRVLVCTNSGYGGFASLILAGTTRLRPAEAHSALRDYTFRRAPCAWRDAGRQEDLNSKGTSVLKRGRVAKALKSSHVCP